VSLLVSDSELVARSSVARRALSALAEGLRNELTPLVERPPAIPYAKALLSRRGGRCEVDGTYLVFDPFRQSHQCGMCGREHHGELHDRFRLYWYQLWLAERTVHAALLGVLLDDESARGFAVHVLDGYADRYLKYPNVDNVLGPSRPFFSTYLESIWLLQITIALSLLESSRSTDVSALGGRVRDRIIAPSAALIASYDEGMSNRQVWNNAALMAAGRMLDDRSMFDRAIHGASGLHAHLATALLDDGTWYEGENYHLFAHRGLWYGERLSTLGGDALPDHLDRRYREAFAAPFRTLLPDLTYPSRRDSQYAVTVRQLRFAESCELGLAYGDDPRLTSMLARLYDPLVPRQETGRLATSADVERNLPATGLRRNDLSWRTLLCARAELPPLDVVPLGSDLLPAQGIGIIRRREGDLYVSLDYGHSGGGHGHPDRLNLTLMDGSARWFDDPGTGSYVDPTLHWYRSTLAHNAPLVDRHSQPRVHGELIAFEDDGVNGKIVARASLAPCLVVQRTVVVQRDYLVDVLQWTSREEHEMGLPMHGVTAAGEDLLRSGVVLEGGTGIEDGFAFLENVARVEMSPPNRIALRGVKSSGAQLEGWTLTSGPAELWTATAPAPPNAVGRRPLALLTQRSPTGTFVSVWSWNGLVFAVTTGDHSLEVVLSNGSVNRHTWQPISLEVTQAPMPTAPSHLQADLDENAVPLPAQFLLGEPHYRRSESSWVDAGAPEAHVAVTRPVPDAVVIEIDVPSSPRNFVSCDTENELDNEPASINGDSVQLYAIIGNRTAGVLLVPRPDSESVDVRPIDAWTNEVVVNAFWQPTNGGYRLVARLALTPDADELQLDVIINESAPGRARRRGQLVMSGAAGEFIYLRGDRHEPSRLLRFSLRQ
jgi:Heparinase II/III-like protein.